MPIDVQSPLKLSIPTSTARDPILADRSGHGWDRILENQNTAYEILRGPLVNDAGLDIGSVGPSIVYRVRVPGSGGGLASEPATVMANGTTLTAMTVRVSTGIGPITNVFAAPVTETWETFASDLLIDDSPGAEFEDITVDLSVENKSTLNSIAIFYKRAKPTLSAGIHDPAGFVPFETSGALGRGEPNAPVNSAMLYTLHDNAVALWEQRMGQLVQKGWKDNAPYIIDQTTELYPLIFAGFSPPGVTEARFYVRRRDNDGGASTSDYAISRVDSNFNVISSDGENALGVGIAWGAALDVTVAPGLNIFTLTGDNARFYTVSGWWKDRSYF